MGEPVQGSKVIQEQSYMNKIIMIMIPDCAYLSYNLKSVKIDIWQNIGYYWPFISDMMYSD